MWKLFFGNVSKVRAVSYFILLIAISILRDVVSDDFNDAVLGFYILVCICFFYETTVPAKSQKRKT